MTVRVLGPLDTGAEESLSPRERAILSALIVRAGTSVSSDELAEAYWGDSPPRTWPQQVKTSVARIRSRIGHDAVLTRGSHYALGIDTSAIDAFEFERLISRAREHALHADHDRAIDAYRRALGLWRGRAYSELEEWEPARAEATRLAEIRRSAEEELLEERLHIGAHREIIAEAERAVRAEPLREERWAILALANYRAGRQFEGLAAIRAARERLADELGLELSPRLRQLETAMLRQDATLDAVPAPAPPNDLCPYRGLAPFGPDDAEDFFGRQEAIEAILSRIRPGTVLTIVGASGSGKSSLVLAGVIPRERESGRRVEILRGGATLVHSLRTALHHRSAPEVMVVDQAEAILQLDDAEVEVTGALLEEALRLGSAIVLTLRSDFLDRAVALPHIGPDIARGLYALSPLSEAGLREAVTEPAARAGLRLEAGLVELIVRDAVDRQTTLPHVSHALLETWVRREGSTLTVDGYEDSGGIAGAIAQSAENVYQSMDAADAAVCRAVMLRLIQRDVDGRSVRRPAQLAPLLADPQRRRVLERLVAARLLTLDGDTVLVAHEAIAAAWPRLDGWLEEDAGNARLVAAVATAADLWNGSGRRPEDLLRGARLQRALDWSEAARPDFTAVETDFLDASAERERDEIRELAERAEREKRSNRRLRGAVVGAAVLLVAAMAGGGLAAVRGSEAETAAENGRVEALVATSLALLDNDRETAALLAAEAYRRWPDDPRVPSALWGVTTSTRGLVDVHHDESAWWPSMSMLPGSNRALRVAGTVDRPEQRVVDVIDVATGEVVDTLDVDLPEPPVAAPSLAKVSPDGAIAAVLTPIVVDAEADTCCGSHLTFIDVTTGEPLAATAPLPMALSRHLVFDPTARTLFATDVATAEVLAFDTATGGVRASSPVVYDDHPIPDIRDPGLVLIGDDLIAVGAGDHLRLYDRDSLVLTRTIPLEGDVAGMDLIDDGHGGVVATGWDGTVRVDLTTGEVLWRRFQDQTRNCDSLYLATPDSVACGSYAGIAVVDLASGEARGEAIPLQLPHFPVFEAIGDGSLLASVPPLSLWVRWRIDGGSAAADIAAKGRELVNGPEKGGALAVTQPAGGGRMRLWDLESDAPVGEESDLIVPLGSGVVARYEAYEGSGVPRLVRVDTGEVIPLRIPGAPKRLELSPGTWAAPAFAWWPGGKVVAFDPSTGEPLGPAMAIPTFLEGIDGVSESPDSTRAVVTWFGPAQATTETAVFDIATGELVARGLDGLDTSLVIDDDQFVGIANASARRYDIHTLEPISALARAIGGGGYTSVTEDGRTLLNVGAGNAITLYDLTADLALASPVDSPAVSFRLIDGFISAGATLGGFLTADGETMLEALPDGIRVWDLRPAEQASNACAIAGRELSAEEWSTYFPGEEQVDTCAELAS